MFRTTLTLAALCLGSPALASSQLSAGLAELPGAIPAEELAATVQEASYVQIDGDPGAGIAVYALVEEGRLVGMTTSDTFFPDGDAFFPDGDTFFPDGDTFFPDGDTFFPDGDTFFPDGDTFFPSSDTFFPSSDTFFPEGGTFFPSSDTFHPAAESLWLALEPAAEEAWRATRAASGDVLLLVAVVGEEPDAISAPAALRLSSGRAR